MSFDFDDFDVRSRFIDVDEKNDEVNVLLDEIPDERDGYDERCKIAYIHHDCALDGIVLTYHELRAAVDRKVMSDSALIPAYQEIKNHSEALEVIQEHCREEQGKKNRARNPKVTVQLVGDLHVLLNKDLPRKTPGVLRKDMPLHRTYFHEIFEPDEIEDGLKKVCDSVSHPDFRAQHPINQASLFHHGFMRVFPYSDGAGKVGRLLMNYFLMRAGYVPAVIHACDRQRYYESLKQGPEALRVLIIDSMEAALDAGVRHLRERIKVRRMPERRARYSIGG
jgi:Fic family protein